MNEKKASLPFSFPKKNEYDQLSLSSVRYQGVATAGGLGPGWAIRSRCAVSRKHVQHNYSEILDVHTTSTVLLSAHAFTSDITIIQHTYKQVVQSVSVMLLHSIHQ